MWLWILAFAVLAVFVYKHLRKLHHYWKDKGVKQKNPVVLFGDNWRIFTKQENIAEMNQRLYNEFPDSRYMGFYQMYLPFLMIRDPELIKQIAVKDFDHFLDHRKFFPDELDPLWSKNLFALTGQKWRDMRATLSPSFTSSKMKYMFTLISESAENFIQHFQKQDQTLFVVEMKDTFTRFTNDVIATTAFGIKVDSLENRRNEFYLMGKEATNFSGFSNTLKFLGYSIFPSLFKFFGISFFSKKVTTFFENLIYETLRIREKEGIVRNDMINLLMYARKGIDKHEDNTSISETGFATVEESDIGRKKMHRDLTDEDIASQAFVFFIAGFESVSGLMCFMSYELGVNQDVQDKLREEIENTLRECNGKLTYEALMNMKYLDMVVSESLRKWPNAVATDRVCTKPYTIQPTNSGEKSLHLKENDCVWIPFYAIHRDAQYYPEPEKFNPERFNDENKHNIKPYTYMPFGLGPRNCIGSRFAIMETKAIFFHLLSKFKIVPTEKTKIPLQLNKSNFQLTSDNGFWFGLQKIKFLYCILTTY